MELTESQLDLNARAIEFIAEKQYAEAVKLFESSLALGKSNVTYLNLGRTLSKLGRCSDAGAAYDAVESAPQVPEPSPQDVATTLERYRSELSTCGTRLVLRCEPADLRLSLDGAEAIDCPAQPLQVDSGTIEIVATRSDDGASRTLTVDGHPSETVQMLVVVPPAKIEAKPEPLPVPPKVRRADMSSWRLAGWAVGLTGVAVFTAATAIDLFVISPKVNDFDARNEDDRKTIQSSQRVNRVLFPLGAILGVAGAGLLLWPAPVVETGSVGASWRFVF